MLRHLTAVLCIALILTAMVAPTVAASEIQSINLEGAIERAYRDGNESRKAELELEENLLQAANLEHEHRLGPPGRQTMNITFEMPDPDSPGDTIPVEMSLPMGGPSDLEKAQIEEVLPIQFASMRRSSEAAFEQRMAGFRADVIDAYFGAILGEREVELRRASEARLQIRRDQVEAMYRGGMVPEMDLVQVGASLASARADRFEAEENARLARASLNRLLGLPLDAEPSLLAPQMPTAPPETDLRDDILEAREANAEISALEGQLEVAEKEMELYRRIKGGFSARRAYRERELEVQRKQIELREAEVSSELGMWNVRSQIDRALAQLESRREAVAAARHGLEVARVTYEAGMNTITEVLEAESGLLGAELAELGSSVEVLSAHADRDTLLGRVGPHVRERIEAINSGSEDDATPEPEAIAVRTTTAGRGEVSRSVSFFAQVQPRDRVDIAAEVTGKVEEVLVSEGDVLEEDDLLIEIDSEQLDIQLRQARSELDSALANLEDASEAYEIAKREVKRLEPLYERGAISEQKWDSARDDLERARRAAEHSAPTAVEGARAAVDGAQKRLDDASVRAPIAGEVAALSVSRGDQVGTGTHLLSVVDRSTMELVGTLNEDRVSEIEEGMSARVRVNALGDRDFEATVSSISFVTDPGGSGYPVKLLIEDPSEKLRGDMSAEAFVEVEKVADVVVLPLDAVVDRQSDPAVFSVGDGETVTRHSVTLGLANDDVVEIRSGVEAGETVVISGQSYLDEGSQIRIVGEDGGR
ncbi:MAG: efflux RND transporter periplasmic adaptor subunit [Clostridia bacterium]